MTRRAMQYPLPFEAGASMLPEDYIITDSNRGLSDALRRVPSENAPVVVLLGASGSGKTHALRWLQSQDR